MRELLVAAFIVLTLHSAIYCGVIYYDDPIAVGIGARPIGMGKAFVAVADDANAIFLNPAGLGSQKNWTLSTMSSNFMNEYQYTMISGINPTPMGVFGIGYVSSRIGGIAGLTGTSDFYNQAMVLSYGKYIGDTLSFAGGSPDLYAGATAKFYSKGFTGAENASGSGNNLDLGFKYSPQKWMSCGLNFQNVMDASRIEGDFDPEVMPFITKFGLAFHWEEYDARIAIDKDMFFTRPNVPWPIHIGAEWRVHSNLVLRAGSDQAASSADSGDLVNNTTFGIGLEYSGIKLDVAYLQNYAQTNLSSNVVSLSFYSEPIYIQAAPPPAPVQRTEPAAPVVAVPVVAAPVVPAPVIAAPKKIDKKISFIPSGSLYTLNNEQIFRGTIDFDVTDVWLDGRKLQIRSDREFVASVPLNIGKNEKKIKVRDTSNSEAEIVRKIVRFYVPTDMAFEEATNRRFEYKVIYTEFYRYFGKDYNTNKKLSREILALILAKAKKLDFSLAQKQVSSDVNRMYWAAGFIRAVKAANLMHDYRDGAFRPERLVARAELAYVMSEATGGSESSILGYLAGRSLEDNATLGDLIDIVYRSGMLEEEVNNYRDFLGIGGPMI
ncbi:MAG: S-layer homology domain-containing protein [bacterium]